MERKDSMRMYKRNESRMMFLLRVSLFFVVVASIECISYGDRWRSPSECRCLNAIQLGFTDVPPFDGQYVVLHFSAEYNVTELEETIKNLGPSVVVWYELCKDVSKREEAAAEEKRKQEADRIENWKQKALAANLEKRCKTAKAERASLLQRNEKKNFFQTKEVPQEWSEVCPCSRTIEYLEDYDYTYTLDLHPCTELACLNFGKPYADCYATLLPPKFRSFCVNRVQLKV